MDENVKHIYMQLIGRGNVVSEAVEMPGQKKIRVRIIGPNGNPAEWIFATYELRW